MNPPGSRAKARFGSVLSSLREWLRSHGIFDFRRARVVCRGVPATRGPSPTTGIVIREASAEDMRAVSAARPCDASEWLARSAHGNVCLVACSGSEVLGYVWISRSRELMTEVNHVVDVSRDGAGIYLFDGFVFPSHRRKGVLRTLLTSAMAWARDHGAARVYAAFARENHASERALIQAGFVTVVGDVSRLLVLGREWKRVRVPRGSPWSGLLSAAPSSQSVPRPT